ncbi:hypothetical protein Ais01nite_59520 [Asanoa ishikariensis]|uniref:Collagen triple helix repeat-containing protein n=1 Tax=Asanoa ishikariensis TaxID=137265 RepID=A0A1H3PCJ5_9ACTN|nr:hypothetical protein [Asanoa ishikariensis]GIF67917.1 hypothetical protein Ais01nite_59520 [Asanoa ishikariensis]SDY98797.1 hypothetical protein SAMN05421684_2775 [Asanoa ishikariensis]
MKAATRHRVLGITGLAAAALLTFGSLAQAEPEAASVINACVNRKTGDVRIPDPPREGGGHGCDRWEQRVSWNVRGPQGPPGQVGTPGVIADTAPIPANTSDESILAFCPDGTALSGGGFEIDQGALSIVASAPVVGPQGGLVAWRASFTNPTDTVGQGTVWAVCFRPAS